MTDKNILVSTSCGRVLRFTNAYRVLWAGLLQVLLLNYELELGLACAIEYGVDTGLFPVVLYCDEVFVV